MFDYSQLASELAREAAAAAKRIRENCEMQVIAAIEIGQDLILIKDQLEYDYLVNGYVLSSKCPIGLRVLT